VQSGRWTRLSSIWRSGATLAAIEQRIRPFRVARGGEKRHRVRAGRLQEAVLPRITRINTYQARYLSAFIRVIRGKNAGRLPKCGCSLTRPRGNAVEAGARQR